MRWMQPWGRAMQRGVESGQWTLGTNRTVLVKDSDVEGAFKVLNRSMSREGMLGILRRTVRFEKPFMQRNRRAWETCRSIYNEDMDRKIAFLARKNRKDPNPGLY